jgi:heme-degrading monooxygenase HmoA
MAVKVLITRRFKEDKINEAHALLMQLRSLATVQPGYISGQTLVSTQESNKLVVVSTWAGPAAWKQWEGNEKRLGFTRNMEQYLEAPENTEVFLAGVHADED